MMMRLGRPLLLVAALASAGATGCKGDNLKNFDADAKSGPDGKRSGAVTIQPNTTVTDDVNFDQQDQTDWKQIQLTGNPGILEVELHWDNPNSDMNVDIFNSLGEQIAASPQMQPGSQVKKVPAQIDQVPGTYYLRVQAPVHGGSVYTLATKWEVPPPPPPPPPPPVETEAPVVKKEHHHPVEHHEHHRKGFSPENGVQGRIVGSYPAPDGGRVINIDKGSAEGVNVGTNGVILEGPAGANPLDGGTFEVTEVVGEHRSVGKTPLKSLGKNIRVSLNVK